MKPIENDDIIEFSIEEILKKMISIITNSIKNSSSKSRLIAKKKEFESLLRLLNWAKKNEIVAGQIVYTLPANIINSPSSNYRIVDDCETDDQTQWIELTIDNEKLFLTAGDKIIIS